MFETTFGCSDARVARARHDHEHDLAGLDERDRAVLELAGREALGVDVRELLELERTLERDRVADVAAEEEHRLDVGHPVRELPDVLSTASTSEIFSGSRLQFGDVVGGSPRRPAFRGPCARCRPSR